MYRTRSITSFCHLAIVVVFTTFMASVAHSVTDYKNTSSWYQDYQDSLSVLPAEAKRPGFAKPKTKSNTKKNSPTAGKRSTAKAKPKSTLPKRVSNLRLPSRKQAIVPKLAQNPTTRALHKSVKATARQLAKRALTPVAKKQAKAQIRQKTKAASSSTKWLPKSLKSGQVLSRGNEAKRRLHKIDPNTRGTFKGDVLQIKLKEPMIVHRRSGGGSADKAPWFSAKKYRSAAIARRFLSLPNNNSASKRNTFELPAGSTIFIGKAAPQTKKQWAGRYATGGGIQIYAPKIGKIKKL